MIVLQTFQLLCYTSWLDKQLVHHSFSSIYWQAVTQIHKFYELIITFNNSYHLAVSHQLVYCSD